MYSFTEENLLAADLRLYLTPTVSQEEWSIVKEVILSVILSKKLYMYMCPIPNGFRDTAVHCTDEQHATSSHELQSALMLTVKFSKMYFPRKTTHFVTWPINTGISNSR
jgi:hypothetical protein